MAYIHTCRHSSTCTMSCTCILLFFTPRLCMHRARLSNRFCLFVCLSFCLSVCLSVSQSSKNVQIRPMRRVYGYKEHLNKRFISLPMCLFRLHGSFSIVLAVSKIAKFSRPTNYIYVPILMECTGDLLNYREHAYVRGIAVPPAIYGQYNVVVYCGQ